MRQLLILVSVILFFGSSSLIYSAEYDIVIKNGLVFDGSGTVGKIVTVAVKGDEITYVGPRHDLLAENVIDAKGMVVSPGFIDVHNHAESEMELGYSLSNTANIRQGVTTLVTGPDGALTPGHIRYIQEQIKTNGSSTNIAVYVGHNGIREQVMGQEAVLSNEKQLTAMKALVSEAMELGAVGLSTGLMYAPGMYSNTEEVIELAKVAASYGGTFDSHVRSPVHELIKSYEEVIEIGKKANIAVKFAHAKLVGLPNRALFPKVRKMINDARNEGMNVVSDQYPYNGATTRWLWSIIALPSDLVPKDKNTRAWVSELLSNSKNREKVRLFNEKTTEGFSWIKAVGYTSMRIVVSEEKPSLVDKHISELAQELDQNGFDVIADMITNPELNIKITLGSVLEENVRAILQQPWNMISSDGAWSDEGEMVLEHPRSTGSFARVLGKYVRQDGLLDLAEAIRKMSGFPADFIGLGKRGYIRTGYIADIAIFDPEKIIDKSDWIHPERLSVGMNYVLVNGQLTLDKGEMTGAMKGQYVKHQRVTN